MALAFDAQRLLAQQTVMQFRVSAIQEARLLELQDAQYLCMPVETSTLGDLSAHVDDIMPIVVLTVPPNTTLVSQWILEVFDRWATDTDIRHESFLDNLHLLYPPTATPDEQQSASDQIVAAVQRVYGIDSTKLQQSITTSSLDAGQGDLGNGVYMIWRGTPCKLYRTFEDVNMAFTVATVPRTPDTGRSATETYGNLGLVGDYYTALKVAVPLREHRLKSSEGPLVGLRFAVKDIYDIKGMRKTAGCRAFFDIASVAERTAPAVQKLTAKGAHLVGALKLGSLITREEPSDSADYFAAFNPRGDGYQSAWSSSGGSGAAIAAYDWLDFTIATDTTGSSRRPALANGVYGLRLTSGALSMEGVLPAWPRFDSNAVYTRDLGLLETVVGTWTSLPTILTRKVESIASDCAAMDDLQPRPTIIWPEDFWPLDNDQQMNIVKSFVADFEKAQHTLVLRLSIADEWSKTRPSGTDESIQRYLKDTAMHGFVYGNYHAMDDFRSQYRKSFGKEPYVNPVLAWRWNAARNITEAQHAEAIRRLDIYRDWFSKEILRHDEVYVILPLTVQKPDYRDEPDVPPSAPNAFDGIYQAPILGAPELTIPIGEMDYDSRVSGRKEYLPIAVSIMSRPGTDMALLRIVHNVLTKSGRPTSVKTGSRLFT